MGPKEFYATTVLIIHEYQVYLKYVLIVNSFMLKSNVWFTDSGAFGHLCPAFTFEEVAFLREPVKIYMDDGYYVSTSYRQGRCY